MAERMVRVVRAFQLRYAKMLASLDPEARSTWDRDVAGQARFLLQDGVVFTAASIVLDDTEDRVVLQCSVRLRMDGEPSVSFVLGLTHPTASAPEYWGSFTSENLRADRMAATQEAWTAVLGRLEEPPRTVRDVDATTGCTLRWAMSHLDAEAGFYAVRQIGRAFPHVFATAVEASKR